MVNVPYASCIAWAACLRLKKQGRACLCVCWCVRRKRNLISPCERTLCVLREAEGTTQLSGHRRVISTLTHNHKEPRNSRKVLRSSAVRCSKKREAPPQRPTHNYAGCGAGDHTGREG
eukprot:3478771-Prymnesium_polylepis.1